MSLCVFESITTTAKEILRIMKKKESNAIKIKRRMTFSAWKIFRWKDFLPLILVDRLRKMNRPGDCLY